MREVETERGGPRIANESGPGAAVPMRPVRIHKCFTCWAPFRNILKVLRSNRTFALGFGFGDFDHR